MKRILIVEDEGIIRSALKRLLERNGYQVDDAGSVQEATDAYELSDYSLIISDLRLPGAPGTDLIKQSPGVPVLIMTSYASLRSAVDSMKMGAVDYIAKPFNPQLLQARIKAVLSRAHRSSSLVHRRRTNTFHFQGWSYDAKRDEVRSPEGFQVALSRRETALLQVFLANPHIPLTRDEIAAALDVTGSDETASDSQGRAIDVLVGRLRSKIEKTPKEPQFLKTERGVGYVFATDVAVEDA